MSARAGGAAGVLGALLFVAAALVLPERPPFDAHASEVAAWYGDEPGRIRAAAALDAAAIPLLVALFATVATLAGQAGAEARAAGLTAFGCAIVFAALFGVDVTTLAIGALRPENMTAEPELAATLQDVELLLMGTAAFALAAAFAAVAVLVLRLRAVWPRWVGALAALAAALYLLRVGTLFTVDGVFAADGLLGLYVPVAAAVAWILSASATLLPRPPAVPP